MVSTRNEISKERAAKQATLSKEDRKQSAKCVRALSRPHDAAYMNELKAVKEEPTPKRAEYLMEFAEDMEEYDEEYYIHNYIALISISSQ